MAAANDLPSTVYATSYLLTQTRGGADFDPPAHFLRAPLDVDQVGATCFRVRLSGSTRVFGLAKSEPDSWGWDGPNSYLLVPMGGSMSTRVAERDYARGRTER